MLTGKVRDIFVRLRYLTFLEKRETAAVGLRRLLQGSMKELGLDKYRHGLPVIVYTWVMARQIPFVSAGNDYF